MTERTTTAPTPTPVLDEDLARDLAAASLMLARRFADAGTLWCVSPSWPHHARHVAVEFVHPVIVGKRALPSVALSTTGPIEQLRANVRAGDVILMIGDADSGLADVARRADAWGVWTVWIGAGLRPVSGLANHVLWFDDDQPSPVLDGRFILLYHLLWELTHVCLEHPGALVVGDACTDEVCITCSDEGRPGEVMRLDGPSAQVRTATGVEAVDVTLLENVAVDDLVLVHAGMAITSLGHDHG